MDYQELIEQSTPRAQCCKCSEPAEWPGDDGGLCQQHWEDYCSHGFWNVMNELARVINPTDSPG